MLRFLLCLILVSSSASIAVNHNYRLELTRAAQGGDLLADAASQQLFQPPPPPKVPQDEMYVQQIIDTYSVDEDLARTIVKLAHKYERETFPKAKDIIAIVGIESSFRPDAQSSLVRDPAVGLMQIRPGVWQLSPKKLLDIERNIEHGANILEQYYNQLGRNKESAIQAYNIGITAYRQGETNPHYLKKYWREVALYTER